MKVITTRSFKIKIDRENILDWTRTYLNRLTIPDKAEIYLHARGEGDFHLERTTDKAGDGDDDHFLIIRWTVETDS